MSCAQGAAGGSAECHDQLDGHVNAMGGFGLFAVALLFYGLHCVIKICSYYEILQSLAESVNVCLLLLGVGFMLLASVALKQLLCLSVEGAEDSFALFCAICMFVYGVSVVVTSFGGFVAAVHEHGPHLLAHAVALSCLTVIGFALAFAAGYRGLDQVIDDNCDDLLYHLPESFFMDFAACEKYSGYGERWNGTGWEVNNIGESVYCTPKDLASFVWEHNPYPAFGGGNVDYFGCLNLDCCESIKDQLYSFQYGLLVFGVFTVIIMGGGIYASLHLRRETTVVGHVLLHPHATKAFVFMKVVILLTCIGLPFVFTGDNCGSVSNADLDAKTNLQSNLQVQTSTAVSQVSCFNGLLDGDETDADCAGSCRERCGRNDGCREDADCGSGLVCTEYSPTGKCFDSRCLEGQHLLKLKGVCLPPSAQSMCSDKQRSGLETGVDCGGIACRSLSPPKLCDLNVTCQSHHDCKQQAARKVYCQGKGTHSRDYGVCTTDCNYELRQYGLNSSCGGPLSGCGRCADGQSCTRNSDCLSQNCYTSKTEGSWNGLETEGPATLRPKT